MNGVPFRSNILAAIGIGMTFFAGVFALIVAAMMGSPDTKEYL